MSATDCKRPLATEPNGLVSPLYFDRQIVRAADLNLGHTSHAAELARMRRYLHGWGIVAGLIPTLSGGTLSVSAGYGVTMTGHEVLLTRKVDVEEIAKRIIACCGPGKPGCHVVDEAEIRALEAAAATEAVESWLIARPVATPSDPRPGVPEGCAHPANQLLPTRACGAVSLELICELPACHCPPTLRCADLTRHVCAPPGSAAAMLTMPEPPEAEENFLVLGKLTATREGVTFSPEARRRMLPVSLLQDWLTACLCPIVTAPPERKPPIERDEGGPDTRPTAPPGTGDRLPGPVVGPAVGPAVGPELGSTFPEHLDWIGFKETLKRRLRVPLPISPEGPLAGLPGTPRGPRPGVVDPPEPEIGLRPEVIGRLEAGNIDGPEKFLAADTAELAVMTGMTELEVEQHKREIATMAPLLQPGMF